MTLGERLTELRKKAILSQEDIAEKIGVSRQTVSKWELDQSLPDFDKILPLCKLYNITSDELLTGRKTDSNNDNMEYNLMTDEEINKKTAIAVSQSVGLFILSVIWIVIGSSIKFISEEVLVGIFLLIVGIGVVNLIYKLSVLPEKSSEVKKKAKKKKVRKYDDVLAILTLIIYLVVSFATSAWHITWILWIVYALVCEIFHIILDTDEEEN